MATNPQVDNLKSWKMGQSGNPKGRPPKLTSAILKEWREAGYERVNAEMVVDIYESLIGMSHEELKRLADDPKQPAIVTIVAKRMVNSHRGFEAIETMIDRAHGKAVQRTQVKGDLDVTTHDVRNPNALQRLIESAGFVPAAGQGDTRAK